MEVITLTQRKILTGAGSAVMSGQGNNSLTIKGEKMKVKDCRDYEKDVPERFNWSLLDSPKLASAANYYCSAIAHELRKPVTERHLTPGLRFALNTIAELADC